MNNQNQFSIETLEIAGFSSALKAMRLPKKSGEKSGDGKNNRCHRPHSTKKPPF